MTIERRGNLMRVSCVGCHTRRRKTFRADEIDSMITDAKQAGWSVRNEDGGYTMTCPDCGRK